MTEYQYEVDDSAWGFLICKKCKAEWPFEKELYKARTDIGDYVCASCSGVAFNGSGPNSVYDVNAATLHNYSFIENVETDPDVRDMYNHFLHKGFRNMLFASRDTRISKLHKPFWINYDNGTSVLDRLEVVLANRKTNYKQLVILTGDNWSGKTSIIEKFRKHHQDFTFEDENKMSQVQKTVIHARMTGSDIKSLYMSIHSNFWTVSLKETDSIQKMRNATLSLLKQCNVKILFIDELHNLIHEPDETISAVIQAIEEIRDELNLPCVIVGNLNQRSIDTERFDVISLPAFNLDDSFTRLLLEFEKRIPLHRPSYMDKPEMASLLYQTSKGNLGRLHRLLVECAGYAIKVGQEKITPDIIKIYSWISDIP